MLLAVDCLFQLFLFNNRRLRVKHPVSLFFQYSGPFELFLVASECAVDGFSFLYSDDKHVDLPPFFVVFKECKHRSYFHKKQ